MSRRPLQHPIGRLAKAQSRMAPGGMLWSESPIPRRYSPRVPMLGEEPVLACGPDYWRTSLSSTQAHFRVADPGGYPLWITSIGIAWTSSVSGTLRWRVLSLDAVPGDEPVFDDVVTSPSAWVTVDGNPGSGESGSPQIGYGGTITGWTLEWDTPGGFADVCSHTSEGG